MTKIRKLYYFDKKNMQEMIPFLNNRDAYVNYFMFNPLVALHHFLPLRLKFVPESYILKDNTKVKGLITVAPTKNPRKRMEIQRLYFEENCYEDATELIQYAVSKYKAMGTISFLVRVDDNLPDLLRIFVSKCDFSQLSHERLWQIPISDVNRKFKNIRRYKNTDAITVSSLYNESLLPHFRPLLGSTTNDFKDFIFKCFRYFKEYKYVIEDEKTKNISGYISIKTADNKNFVMDIIQSSWLEFDINSVIDFAKQSIAKKNEDFNLYLKTKKYTQLGEKYEQFCMDSKFKCIQTQIILTNSTARIIKDSERTGKFTILNQFYDNSVNVPG